MTPSDDSMPVAICISGDIAKESDRMSGDFSRMNLHFLRGDLRSIEVFLKVMESGTTQRAAELLFTTQPTVSKVISALESQLNIELFERSGGRLKPTKYAFRLFREAQQIRDEIAMFERRVREIRDDAVDSLWIESVSTFSISMVPRAIARFKKEYPDIKVNFNVSQTEQIVASAKKGMIDFGVIHLPGDASFEGTQPLCSSRLACILPKTHFLAKKRKISPIDLQSLPLISYRASQAYTKIIMSAFDEYGVKYQSKVTVNHSVAAYATVNAGYGVAVVDDFFVHDGIFPNVVRRPFVPEREITVGIVAPEQMPLNSYARQFVSYLVSP